MTSNNTLLVESYGLTVVVKEINRMSWMKFNME